MFDLDQAVESARKEVSTYIDSLTSDWLKEIQRKAAKAAKRAKEIADSHENDDPGCTWNTGIVSTDTLLLQARRALDFMHNKKIEAESKTWDLLHKVDEKDFDEWNRVGPLILPDSYWLKKAVLTQSKVEMISGDIPAFAYTGYIIADTDAEEAAQEDTDENMRCSICFRVVERVTHLPPGIYAIEKGMPYEVCRLYFRKSGIYCGRDYVTIADDGRIFPCRRLLFENVPIRTRKEGTVYFRRKKYRVEADKDNFGFDICTHAAITLTYWQAKDFHWLASFSNGKEYVQFSVNEDTAKKLLALREKRGDRRLHWVAAHQRKTGAKVRTHLRGDTHFVFDDDLRMTLHMPGELSNAPTPKQREKLIPMLNGRNDRLAHQQWGVCDPLIYRMLKRANLSLVSKQLYDREYKKQMK